MLSVEDGDVTDEADHFAFGGLGDLRGDFLFGFFEFPEFYFDEFMILQGEIDGAEQLFGYAFCANHYKWF